jgi:hypothetical protein
MEKRVILKNGTSKTDLVERLLQCDCCVSDFDYTDVVSPAYTIILSRLLRGGVFNKEMILWGINCVLENAWKYDYIKEKYWTHFNDTFLNDDINKKRAESIIENRKRKLIFPGIKDFYSNFFRDKDTAYITRCPEYLVKPISDELSIKQVYSSAMNKCTCMENFLLANKKHKRYFLKGDSEVDDQMLFVLNASKQNGKIEDFVSCHIAKNSKSIDDKYDINLVGYDYRPLNDFLKKYID